MGTIHFAGNFQAGDRTLENVVAATQVGQVAKVAALALADLRDFGTLGSLVSEKTYDDYIAGLEPF